LTLVNVLISVTHHTVNSSHQKIRLTSWPYRFMSLWRVDCTFFT